MQFWNAGGFWRAVLLSVGYLALFTAGSRLDVAVMRDHVQGSLFDSVVNVLAGLTIPEAIGALVIVVFLWSTGWFGPVFGPQPVRGRRWMWIAPVLVVVIILLRLLGIDYGRYASGVVAVTLASGLLVGFVEETLCRGIVVKMLRDSGKSELAVAVLSSLVFAALHSSNLLGGMSPFVVGVTVVYTFCFGLLMYFTLRVTGRLIWPILIHAIFDPTLFLATGGVDSSTVSSAQESIFLTIAGPSNLVIVLVGLIMLVALSRSSRSRSTAS